MNTYDDVLAMFFVRTNIGRYLVYSIYKRRKFSEFFT
jgi:hypothetical protein